MSVRPSGELARLSSMSTTQDAGRVKMDRNRAATCATKPKSRVHIRAAMQSGLSACMVACEHPELRTALKTSMQHTKTQQCRRLAWHTQALGLAVDVSMSHQVQESEESRSEAT